MLSGITELSTGRSMQLMSKFEVTDNSFRIVVIGILWLVGAIYCGLVDAPEGEYERLEFAPFMIHVAWWAANVIGVFVFLLEVFTYPDTFVEPINKWLRNRHED